MCRRDCVRTVYKNMQDFICPCKHLLPKAMVVAKFYRLFLVSYRLVTSVCFNSEAPMGVCYSAWLRYTLGTPWRSNPPLWAVILPCDQSMMTSCKNHGAWNIVHWTTLHTYLALAHGIAWYCTILHYLALSCTISHYLTLSCTISHYLGLSCTISHYLPLSRTISHYLALSCTILHYLALSCTILHYLALSCTILHYLSLSCNILQWCPVVPIRYTCSQQMSQVIAFDIASVAQKVLRTGVYLKHCQRHYGPSSWLLWPVILVW